MTSSCEHKTSTTLGTAGKGWLAIAGLVTIGLVSGIGAYTGTRLATEQSVSLPPLELHAATAARNDDLSMATGSITNEVEGLWLLDHETGKLQCWVLSPKSGDVAGIYITNVGNDLDSSKGEPQLVLTTGNFFFTGGKTGNQRPANSVCYVANTTSGVVAGYSLRINEAAINRGVTQTGEITKVCTGKIKETSTARDQ